MSGGGTSGTLAHAAGALLARCPGSAGGGHRFAVATAAAVSLHVALLVIRPGAIASRYVAPPSPAPVMAVRVVHPPAPPQRSSVLAEPSATTAPPVATVAPAAIVSERMPSDQTPPPPVREVRPAQTSGPAAPIGGALPARQDENRAVSPTASDPQVAPPSLAAAPEYALGVRLDPGPRPLDDIEPEYPDTVRLREGKVVLRLLISDTGHVDNVAVVRAEPREVFEQAALDAFSKARFSPGLAAGVPVKSQITVEVQFMSINRGGRVSGRTY